MLMAPVALVSLSMRDCRREPRGAGPRRRLRPTNGAYAPPQRGGRDSAMTFLCLDRVVVRDNRLSAERSGGVFPHFSPEEARDGGRRGVGGIEFSAVGSSGVVESERASLLF